MKKKVYILDANTLLVTGYKQLNTEASKLGFNVITLKQFENTSAGADL